MHTMNCKWCHTPGDEFGLQPIYGYDWDAAMRGDDMALSISVLLGHECVNATYCARQVIGQGTNVEALQRIAHDYDNLGALATQAQEILANWAELLQAQAHTADLVAREHGWGAIGGPRGGV